MKLPKPRGEYIEEIVACLTDRAIPIRMIDWRRKEWLEAQDDRTLLRCYVETGSFRLNPGKSKDFLEAGISPAERHARLIEFVLSLSTGDVRKLAVDTMELLFLAREQLASAENGEHAYSELAMQLGNMAKRSEDQRRNEPKERGKGGGMKAAAHWKAVAEEAVRLAYASGLANGQHSAEYVAGHIRDSVRAFARRSGRDFPSDPTRKIAEYLRAAGIKKGQGRTP